MSERYKVSEEYLARALKVIPLGSQTFSKSKTQFPYGISPYFIERGKGSHIWDLDGNEYIDFVNALGAVILGYQDEDVDRAVLEQMKKGVTFSLAHSLETELAELLTEMVPCAEMVRFGKNGSDATTGAIRLARAYTNREHIAACGYHGWQDWYIGTTSRCLGVPQSTRELTHIFSYNNLDSLDEIFRQFPNQIAAVIMEPMSIEFPQDNFLENVKQLAHKHGSLFILDETVTGFRFALGGAQEYFNVIPDLATFGKGMANGYPLSCIVGKREIMKLLEEVFFSFTFGGETLSLAAAMAVLKKMKANSVIQLLVTRGRYLLSAIQQLIDKYDLQNVISVKGHPTKTALIFHDTDFYNQWEVKTLWMQEIMPRGIFGIGSHTLCYAHSQGDLECLLHVYDEVFMIIKNAIGNRNLHTKLHCDPLKPLFQVR